MTSAGGRLADIAEASNSGFKSGLSWLGAARGMITKRARPALTVLLIWTAVGVFQATPGMFRGFHWVEFVAKLVEAWTWALLTPALLQLDRRLASMEQKLKRLLLVSMLLSVPFSLAHTYLFALFLLPLKQMWWNPLRDAEFGIYYFVSNWLTYAAALGILQAFRYHHRLLNSRIELEQLHRRLSDMRLDMLSIQLEPHFLFNALNTVSCQIGPDPELAQEMLEDVGALLRRSIECKERHKVSLAHELSLLNHYLAIQRVRFGKRIDFQIEVDPGTLHVGVPPMLLQPLVENAIRHGLEGRVSGGVVAISAAPVAGELLVKVEDDGVGLPKDWRLEDAQGVGLRVTRERLQTLYSTGSRPRLSIRRRAGGGTQVEVRLPMTATDGDNEPSR